MTAPRHGHRRAGLFWGAIAVTPFLVFATCEGLARLARPADDDFLALRGDPLLFERFERDGAPHVRIAHPEMYGAGSAAFPLAKPEAGLRIFALGGSASAGWPHPPEESYPRYLAHSLARTLPGRQVEVIDASAHAWAAYRVRLVLRQVLRFDPDLVVVYSGNNEFLEPRRYLPESALPERVRRLASVRALRRLLLPLLRPDAVLDAGQREHASFEVWTKLRQRALALRQDPTQLRRVQDHYVDSIDGMAREARAAGVPIVLVSVPVNLRDWRPNVSAPAPAGAVGDTWRAHVLRGRRALFRGDAAEAARALASAASLAPDHAETRFWLATALERAGRFEESVRAFRTAADLDLNPFRALSAFNVAVRGAAERHPHAVLADVEAAFAGVSAPRAPGFDLFLDYVHPTERGNHLVAETVQRAVFASGATGVAAPFPPFSPPEDRGYAETEDPRVQRALLTLFAMMHQHASLVEIAARYAGRDDPRFRFARVWLAVFAPLVELDRRRLAGEPPTPAEEARAQARLEAFYARHFAGALRHDEG